LRERQHGGGGGWNRGARFNSAQGRRASMITMGSKWTVCKQQSPDCCCPLPVLPAGAKKETIGAMSACPED